MKYLTIALVIVFQSCNSVSTETGNESQLVGSWKAVADQELDSNYNVIGQDTSIAGLIIYTPEGKMSTQILWRSIRATIANDSIMEQDGAAIATLGLGSNTWNLEEARKLIDSYDAYFGDYKVDWKTKTVTHTITSNLRPEKEGSAYRRIFKLKGDSLFLRNADPASRWQVAWVKINK